MTSLLWAALLAGLVVWISLITEIIFVDFIHGNPHRSQLSAVVMLLTMAPLVSLLCAIGIIWVFIFAQFLQMLLMGLFQRLFGYRGIYGIAVLIPMATVVTWYFYDYLLPHDFALIPGPEWTPFQHGLTLDRYQMMLGVQIAISLFAVLRVHLQGRQRARLVLMRTSFVTCAALGVIWGHVQALGQYQFL